MALIEIDGLPFLIAWVDLSMANCECHHQRVNQRTGHGFMVYQAGYIRKEISGNLQTEYRIPATSP